MRPINNTRRWDTINYVPERCGNLGIEAERVAEREAQMGSTNLRRATQALFRSWERQHGFVEGAAEILVPAGYRP